MIFIKKHKIIISISAILLVLILCPLILLFTNYGKIAYGLTLANEKIGGKSLDETKEIIDQKIKNFKNRDIIFYSPITNQKISTKPENLGIEVSGEKTYEVVSNFGRRPNFLKNIEEQILAIFGIKKINYVYFWDKHIFQKFIDKYLENLAQPAQNASLKYNLQKNQFELIKSKEGKTIDFNQLEEKIKKGMKELSIEEINLIPIEDKPKITEEDTEETKQNAEKVLAQTPYIFKTQDQTFFVSKELIADWLKFSSQTESQSQPASWKLQLMLDEQKIEEYLDTLKEKINIEPVNANLKFENGKINIFSLAEEGIELKIKESAQNIQKEILSGKSEINLVLRKVPPLIISDASIYELGLTSLLAVGESNFAGSSKSRVQNIKVGSSKFHGMILKPEEEFSFADLIGEISAKKGYVPELVIKNKQLVPEYGGGLCQVATTLFRAAINAGLKITERTPHAFAVSYYNPPGFDATVYPPHPDLRFVNDTSKNILIQSRIEGTKLFFDFYGTDDGRKVKIIGPKIIQTNPDGSMKTVLYQEIWRDNEKERSDTFWSNYKSPALYTTVKENPLE